jgi:hypothetical protein
MAAMLQHVAMAAVICDPIPVELEEFYAPDGIPLIAVVPSIGVDGFLDIECRFNVNIVLYIDSVDAVKGERIL